MLFEHSVTEGFFFTWLGKLVLSFIQVAYNLSYFNSLLTQISGIFG